MRLAQLCAVQQLYRGARQLAGRVFCHFADASANCDYVTPLKSTSIIIIYDVITRWHRAGGRNSRRRRRRRKTCTNQLLLMFARPTCRIRNVGERVSERRVSPLVHVLRIQHVARDALKWLWQIIFLVNAFNMVINQAHTHRHTLAADVCVASKVILLLNPAI